MVDVEEDEVDEVVEESKGAGCGGVAGDLSMLIASASIEAERGILLLPLGSESASVAKAEACCPLGSVWLLEIEVMVGIELSRGVDVFIGRVERETEVEAEEVGSLLAFFSVRSAS